MRVSIHQPAYLPWLGFFHRIAASDLHIVMDDVQYEKNSFINRNKLRTRDGWCWLTVPIKTKGINRSLRIADAEIADDGRWQHKHWDCIRFGYAKAPHFTTYSGALESIYSRPWTRFMDLSDALTRFLLDALHITTPLVHSSELGVKGEKDELVLALCRKAGATSYLSGPHGRDYLRPGLFEGAGIPVVFHDYRHPTYPQVHPGFEDHLSALDLLLNCGESSREILSSGQAPVE